MCVCVCVQASGEAFRGEDRDTNKTLSYITISNYYTCIFSSRTIFSVHVFTTYTVSDWLV